MSDLISRLRKVLGDMECPWDDDVTNDNAFYSKHEIRPLLDALLEVADAAGQMNTLNMANEDSPVGRIRTALNRLEKIAKEPGDE